MLKIGSVEIGSPFIQASLSGYSDLPMRLIARRMGCQLTFNGVILDRFVTFPSKMARLSLIIPEEIHPVGGQLLGNNPEVLRVAADVMVAAGYDIIDINFGCPVKKVLGKRRGGYLLGHPQEALAIVKSVFESVAGRVPVMIKMRRGVDDSSESKRNFYKIIDGAFEIGTAAITVHSRTVEQRYMGPSNWAFLKNLKKTYADRVILGSGDLFTSHDCIRMLESTGVDGVSIARGCIGNPWIFRECEALLKGEALPDPPTIEEQRKIIEEHYRLICEFYGERRGSRIMRKHCIRYASRHPSPKKVRQAFIQTKTPDDWQRVFDRLYDPRMEYPKIPDDRPDLIAAGAG